MFDHNYFTLPKDLTLTLGCILGTIFEIFRAVLMGSTQVHQATHTERDRSKRKSSGKGSTINLGSLIPVFPPKCLRIVIFMTIIVLCVGMTNHPVIKPNNLAACSNINGPCPLPSSWNEMIMRKHCYFCQEGGNAYCIDDRSTNKLYYICITEEEMKCEAGYYGRFSFIELHGLQKIQFEKLTCSTGTHVRNRRDCRRTCEVNDRINEGIFTVQVPQQIDGTPALLTCNTQQNLCPINPQYGEVFPYSRQIEYDDVCGAIGKDCISELERRFDERKVDSGLPEVDPTTPPPDTTLDSNIILTALSIQSRRNIATRSTTTEANTVYTKKKGGTTVTKVTDGSDNKGTDSWIIVCAVVIPLLLLILIILGAVVRKIYSSQDDANTQSKELSEGQEREEKDEKGTTITVQSGGQYYNVKRINKVEINKYATDRDDTDDDVDTNTELSSLEEPTSQDPGWVVVNSNEDTPLLDGDHFGQTSPDDENSTAPYANNPTSTNGDFSL